MVSAKIEFFGHTFNIYGRTCLDGYLTKKWEFPPFFMSTLAIIQSHLKSFSDFI